MSRGPIAVLIAGCVAFVLGLSFSARYVERGDAAGVPFGWMRGAALRAEVQAERAGFRVIDRHFHRPTRDSLPFGRTQRVGAERCLLVLAGCAGGRTLGEVTLGPPSQPWWRRGPRAHVHAAPDHVAIGAIYCTGAEPETLEWQVTTRSASGRALDREEAGLRVRVLVAPSSASGFVPPTIRAPARRFDAIGPQDLGIASLASLFVLMLGTMLSFAGTATREISMQETLRVFRVAVPHALRGELDARVQAALGGAAPAARELRAAMVERIPYVRAATYQRWTASPDSIAERRAEVLERVDRHRDAGRDRGYRTDDEGLAVLTVAIRHRVELPELPFGIDARRMREALEAAIPRDDRELVSVDARWHPEDRAKVLAPGQLAELFAELVPLDGIASMSCPDCEAPRGPAGARTCAACGSRKPPMDLLG